MKQKFSSLFVLLVLLLTGLQVSAQSTPKPFDIEQPSLRVFLPAPELATGRAVVACRVGDTPAWRSITKGMTGRRISTNKELH